MKSSLRWMDGMGRMGGIGWMRRRRPMETKRAAHRTGWMGWTGKALTAIVFLSIPALPALPALPASSVFAAGPIVTGPAHGALVIVGGGKVGTDILTRMFDLAGGKDAPMVVIPTASGAEDYPADWSGLRMFKTFGATNITLDR